MSRRDRDLRSSRDDDYSDDGGGDYPRRDREESPTRDKLARYRGGGGGRGDYGSPSPVGGGLSVNLNVEQMVSMVYEMRGTLAHEVEARRATEHALAETRAQIEHLKDGSQRDNNKWSNLLGRVKELEVAGKLDTRLADMSTRAEKYARNNDQGKLLQVFQEIKSRLDGQERDYRDGLAKIAREQQRDAQRMEHDLRAAMDQQFMRVDANREKEHDQTARMQARINDLEKEFSLFMSAQAQLQMSINSKEKDGDWLKIYLTEQFNAQKHATETKFTEVAHQLQRLQEAARNDAVKTLDMVDRRVNDVAGEMETERTRRTEAERKVQKAMKLAVTNMSENVSKAVHLLDSKVHQMKTNQNEAITNLHALVQANQGAFERHQQAFGDFVGVQTDQTAKEYSLAQRLDALEEVLKAEIKSRLKNHQKQKATTSDVERRLAARVDEMKAFLRAESETRAKQAQEDEHQAHLLHLAMETRSTLDALVGQVEEQHYVDLRKHEWKAFGQVIEAELKARDEELERKLTEVHSQSGAGAALEEKMNEVQESVAQAFRDYRDHERLAKQEEEDQAHMLHCAMETRAVLDTMVTRIASTHDAAVLQVLAGNMAVLDERTQTQQDQLASLKSIVEAEHDATSVQLTQTHGEVMRLAQELATQVDHHTGQLDALTTATNGLRRDLTEFEERSEKVRHDLSTLQTTSGDTQDVLALEKKEQERMRMRVDDLATHLEKVDREGRASKLQTVELTETVSSHAHQLKALGSNVKDSLADVERHRTDLEAKVSQKVQETATALNQSTTAKVDELVILVKRLDAQDRATNELVQTTETLSSKQLRTDQALQVLQSLVDDSAVTADRKVKELRDRLETDLDEAAQQVKKVDKRVGHVQDELERLQTEVSARTNEIDRLQSDLAHKSGAGMGQVKSAEEGLADLQQKVRGLATIQEVESLRSDFKTDLKSHLDARLESTTNGLEKHTRDLKDLRVSLQALEDTHGREAKAVKESLGQLDDRQVKTQKEIGTRIQAVEESLMKLEKDEPTSNGGGGGGGHGRRIIDASIVEKEVQSVEASVDALGRKLKEATNQQEDALNRVNQEVKKLTLKVDGLESTAALVVAKSAQASVTGSAANGGGNGGSGGGVSEASSLETRKSLADVGFRLDALENEAKKLASVSGLTHTVAELQSKVDLRAKEVDTRLTSHEQRADKFDSEVKRLVEVADESEAKQSRAMKELRASIDAQAQRDTEVQNGLKSEIHKAAVDTEQQVKAAEARSSAHLKALQKQVDEQHTEAKAQFRAVDEKLHDMTWSLEYAKDAAFKADATQVRAGASAAHAGTQSQKGAPAAVAAHAHADDDYSEP